MHACVCACACVFVGWEGEGEPALNISIATLSVELIADCWNVRVIFFCTYSMFFKILPSPGDCSILNISLKNFKQHCCATGESSVSDLWVCNDIHSEKKTSMFNIEKASPTHHCRWRKGTVHSLGQVMHKENYADKYRNKARVSVLCWDIEARGNSQVLL